MKWYAHSFYVIGSLGVFHAPAFAADKKSFRKIRYRKIPGEHIKSREVSCMSGKYMAYVGSYSYTGKAKGITVFDVDVENGMFKERCEIEVDNSSS